MRKKGGVILHSSIGKKEVTKYSEADLDKNAILFGSDSFSCKFIDVDKIYDLIQELSEEYARYTNQKDNSSKYAQVEISQTTAYITSNDDYNVRWDD